MELIIIFACGRIRYGNHTHSKGGAAVAVQMQTRSAIVRVNQDAP